MLVTNGLCMAVDAMKSRGLRGELAQWDLRLYCAGTSST